LNIILDALRTLICLGFFFYASWRDYKTREVSNKVWIFFGPLALTLTTIQFVLFTPERLVTYVLSFAITSALGVAIFYSGGFGGADAKALICLSLALPVYPDHLLQQARLISPLFPITVFTNAVLFAALSILYVLSRNIFWKIKTGKALFAEFQDESIGRRVLTLLCGYKLKISELEKREYVYPLEDIVLGETEQKRRILLVFPKDEKRDEIVDRLLATEDPEGMEGNVFVTPGLPLLIFITMGLIVALTHGNVVWILLSLFMT
jgi:preflagellin peptidase FlaK